jgi:AraC-like DNA-binding protein
MGWTLVAPWRDIEHSPGEHTFGLPDPRLSAHVLAYVSHDFPRMDPLPWRVTPLCALTAVLDLETPVRSDGLPSSPVLGLRDRPLQLTQTGPARGITIALTPLGAHAVFGLPLRELANTALGAADLLGPAVGLLLEQLAEAASWSARFRLLDGFLAARLAGGPTLARPLLGAWQRLTSGPVRVDAVADELGWTRQHLSTRFREQIGLPPKTVARLARLYRAASLAGSGSLGWPDVAYRCGYADQSHLIRDFRALTGCTPTEYRAT